MPLSLKVSDSSVILLHISHDSGLYKQRLRQDVLTAPNAFATNRLSKLSLKFGIIYLIGPDHYPCL